jgi:hypothetical protein
MAGLGVSAAFAPLEDVMSIAAAKATLSVCCNMPIAPNESCWRCDWRIAIEFLFINLA